MIFPSRKLAILADCIVARQMMAKKKELRLNHRLWQPSERGEPTRRCAVGAGWRRGRGARDDRRGRRLDDGDDLTDEDEREERGGEAAAGGGRQPRRDDPHARALQIGVGAARQTARKDLRLERAWKAIQTALAPQRPTPQPHEPAVCPSDRGLELLDSAWGFGLTVA